MLCLFILCSIIYPYFEVAVLITFIVNNVIQRVIFSTIKKLYLASTRIGFFIRISYFFNNVRLQVFNLDIHRFEDSIAGRF